MIYSETNQRCAGVLYQVMHDISHVTSLRYAQILVHLIKKFDGAMLGKYVSAFQFQAALEKYKRGLDRCLRLS